MIRFPLLRDVGAPDILEATPGHSREAEPKRIINLCVDYKISRALPHAISLSQPSSPEIALPVHDRLTKTRSR